MIDLEAIEKANVCYQGITKEEWANILDTWFALKEIARAAQEVAKANDKWGWEEIPSKGSYLSNLFSALSYLPEVTR